MSLSLDMIRAKLAGETAQEKSERQVKLEKDRQEDRERAVKIRESVFTTAAEKGIHLVADKTIDDRFKHRGDQEFNDSVIDEAYATKTRGGTIYDIVKLLRIPALLKEQKAALAGAFAITPAEVEKAIKATERSERVTDYLGRSPANEYDFIILLLKKWQTEMTFNKEFTINTPYEFPGGIVSQAELATWKHEDQIMLKMADPKELPFHMLLNKVRKVNAEILNSRFKGTELEYALDDWTVRNKNMCIAGIVKRLIFNPAVVKSAEIEWGKFVTSVTDVNVAETTIVMKHFVWQIKRKIFSKSVKYHMMPILNGKQGSGKSTAVIQFLDPVKEFAAKTNFKDITDERNHDVWSNYVLLFDEMGHSATANLEVIKQKITADDFTGRVMRSNASTTIKNKTTCVGTSNKDLGRMVFDDTGMRRFYQIECLDLLNWASLGAINYDMLWTSIDENGISPLETDPEMFKKISSIQEEKRQITLVEQFLIERNYVVPVKIGKQTSSDSERIKASDFFKEYQEYEKINTPHPEMTLNKFGRTVIDESKKVPGLTIKKTEGKNTFYDIKMKVTFGG